MAYTKRIGKAELELSLNASGFHRSIDRIKRDGLGGLAKEVQSFAQRHRASFLAVGQAAGLITAGLGAATAAVVTLGQRGAVVGDVSDQFAALAKNVGSTAQAMLGALQRGTVNGIANFDLMRMSNSALGSGLVKTADDMEALAGGARLLAKRTGGDTAEAFDTLTSAIASGRTATLKQLGLFVDSKKAIDDYARAHKMAAADMTDSDRAAALSAATIAALRQQFKLTALDAADFGERIDQLKVRWSNFRDDLALSISQSAVLNTALGSLSDAIAGAFGEDQSERVRRLTELVNSFVIALVGAGQMAVTVADIIRRVWGGLQLTFTSVMSVLTAAGSVLGKLQATSLELAAKLPVVGKEFQNIAWKARDAANQLQGMQESWHQQSQEALAAVRGQSSFHQTLGRVSTSLAELRGRLQLVASHQQTTTTSTAALTTGLNTNTTATQRNTDATTKNADAKAKQAAEWRAYQNFIGERLMEDDRRAMDAANARVQEATNSQVEELENEKRVQEQIREEEERAAAEHRQFKNMVGEREIEDEAERQKRLQEMRERALAPWRDLQDRLSTAASTKLLGLFTGIGGDDEAKRRARDAREDYERLAASGRASAEEITRAFRAMREAEAAAQSQFSDRFKQWLDGLKTSFMSWVNDMVGDWTKRFIGGLLRSLASSAFGQRVAGWLGAVPGLGGLFGAGAAALPGAAAAPSVAALLGPAPAAAAGTAGAGAAAGGGFGATTAAFLTNPWTIGIAAAAIATPFIIKGLKALFGGGPGDWDRIKEARRLTQQGVPVSQLPDWITDDESTMARIREGRLFDPAGGFAFGLGWGDHAGQRRPAPLATPALDAALSLPVYRSTQELGMATLQRLQAAGGAERLTVPQQKTVNIAVYTPDAEGFDRIWNQKLRPRLLFDLKTDNAGVASATRDAALR